MRRILLAIILILAITNTNTGKAKMALYNPSTPGNSYTINGVTYNKAGDVLPTNENGFVLGAVTDMPNGAMWYNPNTGLVEQVANGQWGVEYGTEAGQNNPGAWQAQQEKQAADNAVRGRVDAAKGTILSGTDAAIENAKGTTRNSILDFLDQQRLGQERINTQAANNELNKRRAYGGIMDMIGTGIRSAGTILANKNASSSSAGEAIGAAYSKLGNRQAASANNQYELANQGIDQAQNEFNIGRTSTMRKFGTDKETFVNSIVSDAEAKLAALNDTLAGAALPDRIAIEQEKTNIRNKALASLAEFDTMLQQGVAGITRSSREQNIAKAGEMDAAGQASAQPFNYSTNTDVAYQNGAPVTDLPLFSTSTRRRFQGA